MASTVCRLLERLLALWAILRLPIFGDESTKWRQVGNAVCVQLSFALAIKILELIKFPKLPAKIIDKDINQFKYLDSKKLKEFDNPPTRSEKALFRQFPIKSGNMTVDLTNKVNGESGNWGVVAHAGTGKGFKKLLFHDLIKWKLNPFLKISTKLNH